MSAASERADRTLAWLPVPRVVHELSIAQRVRLGFAVGAAVVVIISLAAAILIRGVTDTLASVVAEVRSDQVTVMTMKDAVSAENEAVQGYLITSEPAFLDGLENGHRQFTAAAARLAGPAADSGNHAAATQVVSLESEFKLLAQQHRLNRHNSGHWRRWQPLPIAEENGTRAINMLDNINGF